MFWKKIKKFFFREKRKWKPLLSYRTSHMIQSFICHYDGECDDTLAKRGTKGFIKYLLLNETKYFDFLKNLHDSDEVNSNFSYKTPFLEDDYLCALTKVRNILHDYKLYRLNHNLKIKHQYLNTYGNNSYFNHFISELFKRRKWF